MKKIMEKFKNTENVSKLDWSLFAIIAGFLFFCFIYNDILYTAVHSNNMFSAVLDGHFLDMYKVNYGAEICEVLINACYDLPIYIIFMIWNIPVWIAQNLFNIEVTSNFLSIIWIKTLLIVFLGASIFVIKKICKELKIKDNLIKWVILIFLSSPLVFSSLFMISQYDIITIFFMLLGIYSYIRGDYKKFILWFAIAIPLKLFALFVFIPLVLLKQKQIFKIIANLAGGCSIFIISRIISTCMPYFTESSANFNEEMLTRLLTTSTLHINLGPASIFLIAYLFICIYCYIKNINDTDELNKYSIYIPFVTFLSMFLFVNCHPYWLIYTTPFFAILIFMKPEYFKVNLILDIGMSISALVSQIITYFWCFSSNQINNMLLPLLFGNIEKKAVTISEMLAHLEINKYMPAVLAIYFATVVGMIVINKPEKEKATKSTIKVERSIIWSRMLLIVPVAVAIIIGYYVY